MTPCAGFRPAGTCVKVLRVGNASGWGARSFVRGDKSMSRSVVVLARLVFACALLVVLVPKTAAASCASPANAIEAENCLPGTASSTWDRDGDRTIEGFTTEFSVNRGETVEFKVNTNARSWNLEIYRLGYYGGAGARRITTVPPSVSLPQSQPACLTKASTGLVDCGNWAVSARWTVPANAVSGIYFARAVRADTGGSSHIFFVVRDDASRSDIVFQTSDPTWQAYNDYGGNSLYVGSPAGRAYEVSYNRPFRTRSVEPETWVFNAEYPMVRWLEKNGYDVTYISGIDTDRNPALLRNHKVWTSNGHDEYWSAGQRASVEAARDAGVHLGFFSGNKVFWRIRWAAGTDASRKPYRTIVCYKDSLADRLLDPSGDATGTWRDGRFNADGGRPENELAGSIFMINGPYQDTLTVPAEEGRMRFWRDTSVSRLATGAVATLARGTLGTEVDVDLDNGVRPAGMIGLTRNSITTNTLYLLDEGGTYGAGTAAHKVTLHRAPSGALVFATGTFQWAWGLDANHDRSANGNAVHPAMQQATVNLFADMGVQPATLDSALLRATPSSDHTPPVSTISSPLPGSRLARGVRIQITGSSFDVDGQVGAVEVSTDGGRTWHPATGRQSWSYEWTPSGSGLVTILARAVDDSANLEQPTVGTSVAIDSAASCTTCTLLGSRTPSAPDGGADPPVELGVTFRADMNGSIQGIRYYKSAANTGTHVGHLWSADGALLGTATFQNESSSGWQQANFATPIPIVADRLYVASYHTTVGHYAADAGWAGASAPPLYAPANGTSFGGRTVRNGVFGYGPAGTFPTNTWNSANYFVDVAFSPTTTPAAPLVGIAVTPQAPDVALGDTLQFRAIGSYGDGTTVDLTNDVVWSSSSAAVATISPGGLLRAVGGGTTDIAAAREGFSGTTQVTVRVAPLALTTSALPSALRATAYSAQLAASGGVPPYTWSIDSGLPQGLSLSPATGVLSGTPTAAGAFSLVARVADASGTQAVRTLELAVDDSLLGNAAPAQADGGVDPPVEVGTTFYADEPGTIRGIRFYKSAANTGTHVAHLWTAAGALVGTATFSGEGASGWQQALFPTPVQIQANTLYVASYHTTVGHYAADPNWRGANSGPLHAPADGTVIFGRTVRNGLYGYGAAGTFPTSSWNGANYWVDVLFRSSASSLTSIAVAPANPTLQAGASLALSATGRNADGSTIDLTSAAAWSSSAPAVATVDATGFVRAVAAGTATLTASLGSVSASTTVSVTPAPLVVETAGLPNALQGVPYAATLTASGGQTPYAWSITGALPAGLSLNGAAGSIAGTATQLGSFTVTVRVTDARGTTASRAFTMQVEVPSNVTLQPPGAVPPVVDSGADSPVALGTTFYADVPGAVRAVRFYKSAANTGTHVVSLWTANGTRIATATASNETASGWQEVPFATPVAIQARTLYVASYHTTVGHYASEPNWAGRHVTPLHAPANGTTFNGTTVRNGVYGYGGANTFPNSVFAASGYAVDVSFSPSAPLPTLVSVAIAPAVPQLHPGAMYQLVATGTYADGSVSLIDPTWSSSAPGVAAVDAAGMLTAVGGGTAKVTASIGDKSAQASVAVTPNPDPLQGPGGPILVIADARNRFSWFLGEILRAEGLNAFRIEELANVTRTVLDRYDVVLLGETPLTAAQASMLEGWVTAGGKLIAMRPDTRLAGLLGLSSTGSTLAEGYLLVDTNTAPGRGITGQTMQFHGTADRYTLAGATAIARLYTNATTSTTAPAVTLRDVGAGKAAAFTFDLARSIVYTRQGNPAWSGQPRDAGTEIRSNDLFFGAAAGDVQRDWVDFAKIAIPQADEQQRLLANLILQMNLGTKPLPRFWYLPSFHKAAVVMTGDDHAHGGTRQRFEDYRGYSPPNCSLDDWECVRGTSYIYPDTPLSVADAVRFDGLGFETALHVTTNCGNWSSQAQLEDFYASGLETFAATFVGVVPPSTSRTHCIIWSDYDSQPKVELAHGIRLDTNYYYFPGSWVRDRPGFMTGSGMPMRFSDRNGNLIDVYQAHTHMTDESEQSYPRTADALLDGALGPNGYYGVFTANMHTDFNPLTWSDDIVRSAQARGVPVVTARQMLTWLDGRNGSAFENLAWTQGELTFDVVADERARNLRAMVPLRAGSLQVASVEQDGETVSYEIETIKGIEYAVFDAVLSSYVVTYR